MAAPKWQPARDFGDRHIIPGDLDLKKVPGLYVIVWSPQEAKDIANLKCPVNSLIRAVLPMQHLNMML